MKTAKLFLLVIVIIAIIGIAVFVCRNAMELRYNNTSNIDDCITVLYHENTICDLMQKIDNGEMSYWHLKVKYKLQCIRKTFQGHYIVFLQNDKSPAFVFLDKNNNPYKSIIIEQFKTLDDFSFVVPGETGYKEILSFDDKAILTPASSVTSTVHLLNDGILYIAYNRVPNGELTNNPIVEEVKFMADSNIDGYISGYIANGIPYILPIDKAYVENLYRTGGQGDKGTVLLSPPKKARNSTLS